MTKKKRIVVAFMGLAYDCYLGTSTVDSLQENIEKDIVTKAHHVVEHRRCIKIGVAMDGAMARELHIFERRNDAKHLALPALNHGRLTANQVVSAPCIWHLSATANCTELARKYEAKCTVTK